MTAISDINFVMRFSWTCDFVHHYTGYFCFAWNHGIIQFGRDLHLVLYKIVVCSTLVLSTVLLPVQHQWFLAASWTLHHWSQFLQASSPVNFSLSDHWSSSQLTSIVTMSPQETVKHLTKAWVCNSHRPPLVHKARHLINVWLVNVKTGRPTT